MITITVTHKSGCNTEGRIERNDLCNCGAAPKMMKRNLDRYVRRKEWGKLGPVVEEWSIPSLWRKRSEQEPALSQIIVVEIADGHHEIICFGVDAVDFEYWYDLPARDVE